MNPEIEERINEEIKRLKIKRVEIHCFSLISRTVFSSLYFALTIVQLIKHDYILMGFDVILFVFFIFMIVLEVRDFKKIVAKFI